VGEDVGMSDVILKLQEIEDSQEGFAYVEHGVFLQAINIAQVEICRLGNKYEALVKEVESLTRQKESDAQPHRGD
jgi:hypothetical protein